MWTGPRVKAFFTGVLEGFFGRPWTHSARLAYADWLPALGLDYYLYAPKADPWLRRRWHEDWPAQQWRELVQLAAHYAGRGAGLGIGLSPYELHASTGGDALARLRAKVARINELGAPLLAILFDDMRGAQADLAERQLDIIHTAAEASTATHLLVCPTYYSTDPVLERVFGQRPARYWETLGAGLPETAGLFWTGRRVCPERLDAEDIAPLREHVRCPVVLWDNYPVNDSAQRCGRLFLAPPPARDPALERQVAGHFSNAMNQPLLSLPALAGLGRLYGRGRADERWLAAVLGRRTLEALSVDAAVFGGPGLDGLPADHARELAARYQALASDPGESAAGLEVAQWLRGEYAFDPACLTD